MYARHSHAIFAAALVAVVCAALLTPLDCGIQDYATDGCENDAARQALDSSNTPGNTDVTFIAFGDPQFGGGSPDKNDLHVRALNAAEARLRWTNEPFGIDDPVAQVRGVIIAGDLTQNGRDGRLFEDDEYARFIACYGLCGNRALRYPVYEGYGNHDYYVWNNPAFTLTHAHPVADSVSVRNACRPGLCNQAPGADGHYSWEWDNIHFVMLNLCPSDTPGVGRGDYGPVPGAQDPRRALSFLKQDLARFVAGTAKRVITISHYGFLKDWDFDGWWTEEEAGAFRDAVRDYDVIAHIHGHDHGTRVYSWNGLDVFDVGSPYYCDYNPDGRGHFTLFRITDDCLYAGDASWDPAAPDTDLRFPAAWYKKIALTKRS